MKKAWKNVLFVRHSSTLSAFCMIANTACIIYAAYDKGELSPFTQTILIIVLASLILTLLEKRKDRIFQEDEAVRKVMES